MSRTQIARSRWPLGIAAGVATALSPLTTASRAGSPEPVIHPSERVAGHRLVGWFEAWWRWRTALPRDHVASAHGCITTGQRHPVWFLGSNYRGLDPQHHRIVINCSVPAGRYLIVAPVDIDCSTIEPAPYHATTNDGLRACARRAWNAATVSGTATIDGARVAGGFVVATPAFPFSLPATDNPLFVVGHTSGRAALYGIALMLRPLSPGSHTFASRVKFSNSPANTVVYRITVG